MVTCSPVDRNPVPSRGRIRLGLHLLASRSGDWFHRHRRRPPLPDRYLWLGSLDLFANRQMRSTTAEPRYHKLLDNKCHLVCITPFGNRLNRLSPSPSYGMPPVLLAVANQTSARQKPHPRAADRYRALGHIRDAHTLSAHRPQQYCESGQPP